MDILCIILTTGILMIFIFNFAAFGFDNLAKILLTFLIIIQFYWFILFFIIVPKTKITIIQTNKFKNFNFSKIVTIKKIETYIPTSLLSAKLKYEIIIPEKNSRI